MKIIEIATLENGGHRNQTYNDVLLEDEVVILEGEDTEHEGSTETKIEIPEGWAVVPDDMETENFPFGEVEVAEIDGVMTVTKWIAGEIPEPEPTPEGDVTTVEERVSELEEALDMILDGVTE